MPPPGDVEESVGCFTAMYRCFCSVEPESTEAAVPEPTEPTVPVVEPDPVVEAAVTEPTEPDPVVEVVKVGMGECNCSRRDCKVCKKDCCHYRDCDEGRPFIRWNAATCIVCDPELYANDVIHVKSSGKRNQYKNNK